MTEDVKIGRVKEKPQPEDSLGDIVAQAAILAVYRSHGAALVNIGAEIDPEAVLNNLPSSYHHISVQDIIEGKARMPNEKSALVVTRYSKDLYQQRGEEDRIESFIRATVNMRELNMGKFSLLVLSDSLPDESIFHNSSLPWFNGPFQGDDSVWSIRRSSTGSKIELVHHGLKSEIVREPEIREVRSWVDKQTIPFEPI